MRAGDARALVRRLLEHTAELPEDLSSDIVSRGPEVVAPLVEILSDASLAEMRAPGEGFAPIHAARLLVRRRDLAAVPALVEQLMRSMPGEVFYDTLLSGLEELGPAVTPVALEALARARTPDERFGLLSLLSRGGVKDERIYAALLQQFEEDPVQGAMNLARYGDARTLEPLVRALDACSVAEDEEDLFAHQSVIELAMAIETLGGTLSGAQREKVERALRARRRLVAMFQSVLESLPPLPAPRRKDRPGRNEPCWCGSGVKYKKCHLSRDARGG
ncbi:SEC-C domain-containing protein [Archangium violaceum]|uniref:SEC-C domain-containing protein n=1 Tax=Archangium violaceum TaxID=83451 RepID=UPI00193C8231|nr:SEC-C metal-binding domain-containing protein [Archangium violaceum]QRK10488.1 SEC-C domain-containing protein [Archangium violaceum]